MAYDIIIGRNESDKKAFGKRGLVYIGKGYVKMGQYTSLSNKIFMDVARSHVVLVAGKRGSGKSYTLGVIAEELGNLPEGINQNIASLIFDTMGIYWTMKFKNEKDKELLREWDLESKDLSLKIFVPFGHYDNYLQKGIPVDEKFALDVKELNPEDWIITFGLNITDPLAVLMERTITRLKEEGDFGIEEIISSMEQDVKTPLEVKNGAIGLFEAAQTWGVFARKGEKPTKVVDLIGAGRTTVLDLSVYNSVGAFNVRALVISLVTREIFKQRMDSRKKEEVEAISKGLDYFSEQESKENPMVWMFIDEAHEFLPLHGKTAATDALIQLLREGRQPGLSVVLATQQPGQIHRDVMTQSDIVISHRVTSQPDLEALNYIMLHHYDNSERIYPMRIKLRFIWYGGEAPTAVKAEKRL